MCILPSKNDAAIEKSVAAIENKHAERPFKTRAFGMFVLAPPAGIEPTTNP